MQQPAIQSDTDPTLRDLISRLNLTDPACLSPQHWPTSIASLPDDGPGFFSESFVREASAYVALDDDIVEALIAEARIISAAPLERALAWHAHQIGFVHDEGFGGLPDLNPLLNRDPGLFAIIAMLSAYPRARSIHEKRSIPAKYVAATMADIPPRIQRYREKRGVYGLHIPHAGGWFTNHFRGVLYRIGRLQYILRPFGELYLALRHRVTRQLLVLAQPARLYRRDGHVDGTAGITDPDAWTPALTISDADHTITGHTVDPVTSALSLASTTLDADLWQPAITPHDDLLEIHIPRGGPMDFEACGRSHIEAFEFFDRHYPERPSRGITCTSWIMDPQLADYLAPTSNMVRNLAEYYLVPSMGHEHAAVRFVYHIEPDESVDLAALPRETSLQKAILGHIDKGNHWRNTRGFILREDLDWGSQPYRQSQ